jgi:hypothetical protein
MNVEAFSTVKGKRPNGPRHWSRSPPRSGTNGS